MAAKIKCCKGCIGARDAMVQGVQWSKEIIAIDHRIKKAMSDPRYTRLGPPVFCNQRNQKIPLSSL